MRQSASLILIREPEFKILLLKRNESLSFGGSYAFPGGCVDSSDMNHTYSPYLMAALRETQEETGLSIEPSPFIRPFIRLITPQMMKKRFDTQFYIMNASGLKDLDNIKLNTHESQSYEWNTPSKFINDFMNNQINLFPPIFLQLLILKQLGNNVFNFRSKDPEFPMIFQFNKSHKGTMICGYGDAQYRLDELIEKESNDDLKKEIQQKMSKENGDCRFYFQENLKYFEAIVSNNLTVLSALNTLCIKDGQFQQKIGNL